MGGRWALGVSYSGSGYHGWQSQPGGHTIQDRLEEALSRFADQRITTLCSGRTDAGVHALMQVVHFDTDAHREPFSWIRGSNRFLPPDISVQWAQQVPARFHARSSALARRYAYVLLESPVRPGVESGRVGWVFRPMDEGLLNQAAQHLLGEHDFTSFRASGCQSHTPVKTLHSIRITRKGAYWRIEFEANAFLHHMIRNIMGCLLRVGQGMQEPQWMAQVLQARDRDAAAPTFSPDGLYFLGPVYPSSWGLPDRAAAFDWLP